MLFMRLIGVGQRDKVRPSLTNETEADKLFPVFEVVRFVSQAGFLTLRVSGQFCVSNWNHKTAKQTCNTKNSSRLTLH